MKEESLRLMIELDPRTQPISGKMFHETGQSRQFTGWLGLAAALGAALKNGPPQTEAKPKSR
jgi:hypothetical protein